MATKWATEEITLPDGVRVSAQAPVIISASRATDIPAFYGDWLVDRLRQGFCGWVNPFNRKKTFVSFSRTRLLVFWTKNPEPFFKHLGAIEQLGFKNYYVQFTLNDYEKEGLEPGLPSLKSRIEAFKNLTHRYGKEKVIWRWDPFLVSESLTVQTLLDRLKTLRDSLAGTISKLVVSFVDIHLYRRVKSRIARQAPTVRELQPEEILRVAEALGVLSRESGFPVATCAETVDLCAFGIQPNRCIDDHLIRQWFSEDHELMSFIGNLGHPSARKDAGQRPACGCIPSKDIGRYGTCPHGCLYCYANSSSHTAPKGVFPKHPNSDVL